MRFPEPPVHQRGLLAACLLLAACGSGSRPPVREPTGINVLLVSLDSTRRDLLSAYGHRAPHAPELPSSPVLDRLAAEGVLFESAYATTSWTLPSHVALLSGQPDLVHGVDIDFHRIDSRHRMLQELLLARGYSTHGVFSGPYLEPVFGFGRGFESYEQGYGEDLARAMERRREASSRLQAARASGASEAELAPLVAEEQSRLRETESLSHRDRSSASVTDIALGRIEQAAKTGRPFFLFAHYFDPHYDYVPPAPFDTAFDPDYEGELDGRDFYKNPAIGELDPSDPMKRRRRVSERDLEHVRALYAGELAWTDAQLGRLLARLDQLGLAERTLVIVSADHGDEFFEHGSIGHRRTLHEEVLAVPLIVRLPGVLPAGKRVAGAVSNADVLATVLELAGLPEPAGLASRSLVPLVRGKDPTPRDVFGRLVVMREVNFDLPDEARGEDARRTLPGLHLQVLESFHHGTLKLTRERSWARPLGLSGALESEARSQARAMRAEERLSWIDLARHPREPAQAVRTDFDDPRAKEALRRFHDRYLELVALRRGVGRAADHGGHGAALKGLGYVGADVAPEEVDDDELVLPPPGAELLRW